MSGDESKGFKSFKDLLRSQGGDEPEEKAPEEDRGWTLESEGEQIGAESADASAPSDTAPGTAREEIARRPAAFGANDPGVRSRHPCR